MNHAIEIKHNLAWTLYYNEQKGLRNSGSHNSFPTQRIYPFKKQVPTATKPPALTRGAEGTSSRTWVRGCGRMEGGSDLKA